MRFLSIPLAIYLVLIHTLGAWSQQNPNGRIPVANFPEPYVLLIRDPAVQRSLHLSEKQKADIQTLSAEVDRSLWPLRNQPAERANAAMEKLTAAARKRMNEILDYAQRKRLAQIRVQVRGTKTMLDDPVIEKLELEGDQIGKIERELAETAKQIKVIRKQAQEGGDQEELQIRAQKLSTDHQKRLAAILTVAQRARWRSLIGEPFNLAKLGRITFKAPDLRDAGAWINSRALTMEQLKGKVVALHFYAFS